jgi:hypothetical protein
MNIINYKIILKIFKDNFNYFKVNRLEIKIVKNVIKFLFIKLRMKKFKKVKTILKKATL